MKRTLIVLAYLAALGILGSVVSMSDLPGALAPDSAEALPPQPGSCAGEAFNAYWDRYAVEADWCRATCGGSEVPECSACWSGAEAKARNVGRNEYQVCVSEPSSYCSAGNPYCWIG